MLSKDSIKTLVANSLYNFHNEILKNEFATKKYVDDNKVIVPTNISEFTNDSKYINQIKVLPVEYDNDKMVNVQNLEPHSIYVVPNDIDYLDLGCMGTSNKLVSVLITPNTEEFIYTGNKTDKYISFRFGAVTHTIYFKTDTASSRIERHAYYLTPSNNEAYTPKNDYNPTTKKYVDGIANTLVKKDTNKYVLITNDDTLIIKKESITDIANATITIDNLTGKFGTLVANDDSTYSYTLNTIMTDVETFTFKVNNVEQKLVIVPYKEMKYDDSNAAITYVDGWSIEKNEKCYNGNIHIVTSSDTVASKANFEFVGTGIEVFSLINNQTGRIQVAIWKQKDDGTYPRTAIYRKTINTNYTYSDAAYAFPVISFDNNEYGKYKIEITVGKGETFYLDSICIHNPIYNLNLKIKNLYQPINENTNILYTNKHNPVFNPSRIYDPTTKKYVDDLVQNSTAMCTDEEVDNMLNEVLGGDYSGN